MSRQKLSSTQVRDMLAGGRRLAPGVWVDRNGAMHFSIPELLEVLNVTDTPENREACMALVREVVQREAPGAELIETEEQTH